MTTRCPGCFQHLPDDGYLWICRSGRCPTQPDDVAGRYAGKNVENGPLIYRLRPANAGKNWAPEVPTCCPECKQVVQEACVRCHHGLLPGWRDAHATCVAMNGSRATGKSLYIAVLVKQLDQLMAKLNSTVEFADARTRENYTEIYEKPLFESRGLMPPTPSAITDSSYQREPLIFSLGILNGMRRFLVIRDVAGEDMERPPADTTPLHFLAHADAVFFMFDPMAVPEIRAKLQDLVPTQSQLGGDPHAVLGNLMHIIGGATPRLAVILSKFDAMQELRKVEDIDWQSIMSNSGAAFLRDPSLESAQYREDDGELLHEEVRSLLHKLHAGRLVLSLENPHSGKPIHYRFFAVSALGEAPRGESVHPRGIAPFRSLDPAKWVLSLTGAI